MTTPSRDPSIEHEPQFQQQPFQVDPSEAKVDQAGNHFAFSSLNDDELVTMSVWDEPGLSPELAGKPTDFDLTYARWLTVRFQETAWLESWAFTLALAVMSGPMAVLTAVFQNAVSDNALSGVLAAVLGAPLVEEIAKIMVPLICVERRPYRFRTRLQLYVTIAVSAATFGAIENALYLRESLFDFSQSLTMWRWSICVPLHIGCSLVAGMGVARIWRTTIATRRAPQVSLGVPYWVAAMVIHGVYNAFAIVFEFVFQPF